MMQPDQYIRSLAVPLPEDIYRRIFGGDLEEAIEVIDFRLQDERLPQLLRERLICERERVRRLPTQYPWNKAEAMEQLRKLVPEATEEEFDRLEKEGRIDFIYIKGEKRYFVRFHRTLYKTNALEGHPGQIPNPHSEWLDPMMETIKREGHLTSRITLETSVHCQKDGFVPGRYRCWLPIPARTAQQRDIVIESGSPDAVSDERAVARCAYWEKELTAWQEFRIRYSYTSEIRYADPLHAPAPAAPLYPDELPLCEEDLSEQQPFVRFTPYLRQLAKDLAGDETEPVRKAWRFYEFCTEKVRYSFMRDYFQLDDIGEYCAVNLRGDCGLQALLFIGLCRISGIPARWQSGMDVEPEYTGAHDWAQFYLDGWGWLFADPSFGGSAWRNGNLERHAFYFGNIDPMRMAANRSFMAPLDPPIHCFRVDPCDNQSGEIERVGAALPFTGRDLDDTAELISRVDLP